MSSDFRTALLKLAPQPSRDLLRVQAAWPKIAKAFKEESARLAAKVEEDDPLRLPVDLLTPLGCVTDEVIHTQALAYLLDPSNPHELGTGVFRQLLAHVGRLQPHDRGISRIQALARHHHTRFSVRPEYRYRIEGFKDRLSARCDIWIELHGKGGPALVIIENKIKAFEHNEQLRWYSRKARQWCKAYRGHAILIYLCRPERRLKETNKAWVQFSYAHLASALRDVWRKTKRSAGRSWLELYIATITRGVLGMDITQVKSLALADLDAYLGERRP